MTARGYQALRDEEGWLKAAVAAAKEDPSARAQLEHRLALVQATLESVRVVEPTGLPGVARFGSTVELAWEDGRVQTLELVGPDEADGRARVSVESPLGQALIGQPEGATVEIDRPKGPASATIRAVR
jgi:transcription elongation factor GreA